MIKNSKNISIKKLKKMLKTELSIIFVTTNNQKFLSLNDALECELDLEKKRLIIKKKRKAIMKMYELLSKVLSKNEWGIFFKGEPMEGFPTQDGMRVYRVNEVSSDKLFDAIEQESILMENECQTSEEQEEGQTRNR
tara:strand:+ start:1924 stop:2334 length:411 start_codon:yes stop_codon:yes gene_type:complete